MLQCFEQTGARGDGVCFRAVGVTAQNVAEQFYIIFRGLKTSFPKQSPPPVCHRKL